MHCFLKTEDTCCENKRIVSLRTIKKHTLRELFILGSHNIFLSFVVGGYT